MLVDGRARFINPIFFLARNKGHMITCLHLPCYYAQNVSTIYLTETLSFQTVPRSSKGDITIGSYDGPEQMMSALAITLSCLPDVTLTLFVSNFSLFPSPSARAAPPPRARGDAPLLSRVMVKGSSAGSTFARWRRSYNYSLPIIIE